MNGRENEMQERRASLARTIQEIEGLHPGILARGAKFSGPWIETFFEGWAKVGFCAPMGHYWRRRPGDRVLSTCGIWKDLQYTTKGQVMIFEVGNFEKCSKCVRMRRRSKA